MNPDNIKKEYTNGDITIVWQSGKCIHSGNCVKNLPEVFKPKTTPWIQPEGKESIQIENTIKKCPSGALTFYYKDKVT